MELRGLSLTRSSTGQRRLGCFTSSPGKYTGEDNGWVLALIYAAIIDFDKSIIKYPNITRYVGGASTDLVPDLQHPENPVPLLKDQIDRLHIGGGGG